MTHKEYKAWDGTFAAEEKAVAYEMERKAVESMTEKDYDKYMELCETFIYDNKGFYELNKVCEKYNISPKIAMIAW